MNITPPLLPIFLFGLLVGGCSDDKPSTADQTEQEENPEITESGTSTNSGGSVSIGTKRSVLAVPSEETAIKPGVYAGIYLSLREDSIRGVVEETYTSIDSAGTIKVFDYQQSNKSMRGNCYQRPDHAGQMNFYFDEKQLASMLTAEKSDFYADGIELQIVANKPKNTSTKWVNSLQFHVTQSHQTETTHAVRVSSPGLNDLVNGLCNN